MRSRLNEKNCVTTLQPYTVNPTMRYYRSRACLDAGVSLLYSFENGNQGYTVVADACADIMMHYNTEKKDLGMDLVGPHDHLEYLTLKPGYTYFGIRFLPGYSPQIARTELLDLKGETVSLCNETYYYDLLQSVQGGKDFLEQCSNVMNCLCRYQERAHFETSQSMLNQSILEQILSSPRNYSLKDLEQYSGYSARYLNKIFRERTGYSIIRFSNVMRAQRVAGYLSWYKQQGILPGFDTIAAELGYSDQSHMIREFKTYFGMTPKVYYQNYL